MTYWLSSYSKQAVDNVKLYCYDIKIYVTQNICIFVIDWCHFYLNHPSVSIIPKVIREVCYWKGLVTQSDIYDNLCKIFKHFKKRKTVYGRLLPKNAAELKLFYLVHVDLMGPYTNSIIQHQPGGATIKNDCSLTCTTIIGPAVG